MYIYTPVFRSARVPPAVGVARGIPSRGRGRWSGRWLWDAQWLGMCNMGGSHRYSVTTSRVATLGVAPSWAESKLTEVFNKSTKWI